MSKGTNSGPGVKVCVTSEGKELDSKLDPRFGRCRYFIFVDTGSMAFEAVENPNIESMGGAGIQSGQFVAEKKVKSVITGNVGPNAFRTLQAAGIDVITCASATVGRAIEEYKEGRLKSAQNPSVSSKFGMPPSK